MTAPHAGDATPIIVITTGGTIDKVYFDASSEYEVGESVVRDLLREAHVNVPFTIHPVMRKDSLDLTDEDREQIRRAVVSSPGRLFIITHGTDTMTNTAAALGDVGDRVVVFTGALAPARFARSDATFNVGMAFAAVQTQPPGVYIVMNGRVFDAARVRKDRGQNAFVALD